MLVLYEGIVAYQGPRSFSRITFAAKIRRDLYGQLVRRDAAE